MGQSEKSRHRDRSPWKHISCGILLWVVVAFTIYFSPKVLDK